MVNSSASEPRGNAICRLILLLPVSGLLAVSAAMAQDDTGGRSPVQANRPWSAAVRADRPAVWLRFAGTAPTPLWSGDHDGQSAGTVTVQAPASGAGLRFGQPGPRPAEFPLFAENNTAAAFDGRGARVVLTDPGTASSLDFANGDAITIEAWVNPRELAAGQQVYLIGKGRTASSGAGAVNQNWALRLREVGGRAGLSFLFRTASAEGVAGQWHRWTTTAGFPVGSGWHHVAIGYRFGQPESIQGWIDGRTIRGKWDMGGPTRLAPVVDDAPVWVGSSLGGAAGSSYHGLIDEIAVYRRLLSSNRIAERYLRNVPPRITPDPEKLPARAVRVAWFEQVPAGLEAEAGHLNTELTSYQTPALAFTGVPRRYDADGLPVDRRAPLLLRAAMRYEASREGTYRFLLRSFNAARLRVDGQIVATTEPIRGGGGGHEHVPEADAQLRDAGNLCPPLPGHQHQLAEIELTAGMHVIELDAVAGGARIRPEIGELFAAVSTPNEPAWRLLAPNRESASPVDEAGWLAARDDIEQQLMAVNARNRRTARAASGAWWARRHEWARETVQNLRPAVPSADDTQDATSPIDQILGQHANAAAGLAPCDDLAFLRRVSLDVRGVVPTLAEIRQFQAESESGSAVANSGGDPGSSRRARFIDRMLASPRVADHWTSFWQDLLAENPGILKPKLNNSGPFRWWIHESLADNLPIDRFVTELILMRGSVYEGGPAGFAIATQNDAPMAAKAHTLAGAFLAIDLTCARCHDAPFHPWKQQQLFSLAAMLRRSPQDVPATSTVPGAFVSAGDETDADATDAGGSAERRLLVQVTLEPGSAVDPEWPFPKLLPASELEQAPAWLLRDTNDSREQLAALMTHPRNIRFAEVFVNRLWTRYFGQGLVDGSSDWHEAEAARPELLRWLAVEFVAGGYDFRHISRLILNSAAYQQSLAGPLSRTAGGAAGGETQDVSAEATQPEDVSTRARRRMTAEQLLDSLFVIAGKSFDSEELNLDPEGRRPVSTFLNLGTPSRAWQLTSLSNERDRPALAMPRAQSLLDVLSAFGWRETRQNPQPLRDHTPTVLQPLMLANGIVAQRIVTLSDDSRLTEICLRAESIDQLADELVLTILGREPSTVERELFDSVLTPGFTERLDDEAPLVPVPRRLRQEVSWSNHLSPEATRIKLELEEKVRQGDPPTRRLNVDWRERAEDVIWALLNSPEFLFLP